MKICLLNVHHDAFDKRVYHKIARSLVGAGHELISIGPAADPVPERDGVRFVHIPDALSKKARLISLLRLVQQGRREHADVYLAPEPESWVAALMVKFTRGGKVIFDMHEHVPTEFAKFFPKPMQGFMEWLTVRFMRLFALGTDLIILTRDSFETSWKGLRTPRVTVINTNHLQPACSEIPAELAARYADRPTIIHQGQFGDVRGSYQLLDAMQIAVNTIPDLKCIVLGEYVFGDEDAFRNAIEDAGLSDHIDMPGVVPFEAVPAYIAVSRIGLILFQPGPRNHTLAMPHKMFDYMREGKPTIAPDFALEVRAILNEADAGALVDVTVPQAIADAIVRLLNDPEEAARLGQNGRRMVESKYNWQHDEQVLLNAIAELDV